MAEPGLVGIAVGGSKFLATARLIEPVATVVGSLLELLLVLVSLGVETVAVLVTVVAVLGLTVKRMVLLAVANRGPGLVQVTVAGVPVAEQVQPELPGADVAET